MIDVLAIAAQLAVAEVEAERIEAAAHRPVAEVIDAMRGELTPHFQRAWDDPSPKQYHRTGKRMGKSEYIARRLVRASLLHPRSTNPYITPTAKQARLLMWPILRRVVEAHVPDAKILDHEMTVRMPEGGVIVVGGCECRADIGRWFGIPFGEAAVDECGTFPSYLRELVDDGLEPSTMDFGGNITLAGNPGPVPVGYWYELTGPQRLTTVPLYEGDARDNPHVKAQEFFDRKLVENGWTVEHPTFQRMYLGLWCSDPSALCFPYLAHRNAIAALPERSAAGGLLGKNEWRFSIAADVAGLGITAITIMAAHPGDPRTFVWSAENHREYLPEQLAERVRAIKRDRSHGFDMSGASFVVDVGGLGSVHNLHLTRKAADLYHKHAEKTDKKSAVRETHDELLAGRLQVLEWDLCDPIRDEWAVLEWDDKHELWLDGPPDHCTDAGLYAKRDLRQYTSRPAEPPLTPEQQRDAMEAQWIAQRLAAAGRPRPGANVAAARARR